MEKTLHPLNAFSEIDRFTLPGDRRKLANCVNLGPCVQRRFVPIELIMPDRELNDACFRDTLERAVAQHISSIQE